MAADSALNDDVMLCIIEHCDIDTFLTFRQLSHGILNLITRNSTRLLQKVADIQFPTNPKMLRLAREASVQDLQWLKGLRFEQIAAIVVERTHFNQFNSLVFSAASDLSQAKAYRDKVERGWQIMAMLHRIHQDMEALADTDLPEDTEFELPPLIHVVGRCSTASRRITVQNSKTVGSYSAVPFTLDAITRIQWQRSCATTREQIAKLRRLGKPDAVALFYLLRAFIFEFNGRAPFSVPVHGFSNATIPPGQSLLTHLLGSPVAWGIYTMIQLGPSIFWSNWSRHDQTQKPIIDRLAEKWIEDSINTKVLKSIHAGFLLDAIIRIRDGRYSEYNGGNFVFRYSARRTEQVNAEALHHTFPGIDYDFRLNSDRFTVKEDKLPNEDRLDAAAAANDTSIKDDT